MPVIQIKIDKEKKKSKSDPFVEEIKKKEKFKKNNPETTKIFDSVVDKLIDKKEDED